MASGTPPEITNGHLNLPDGLSPGLYLVQPTEEERLAQWTKNSQSWKGALSADAYLRREHFLADQDLTKDGGISWWALVDSETPNARTVLSGCESFRKRALVARGGKVEKTICHGIGSVFCPPEFRGRGYAGRMMKELSQRIRTYQAEDADENLFSVLFSDIGKKFYSALGWEPFNSAHISLPVTIQCKDSPDNLPLVRPLYADDLPELCKIDVELIRKSLENRPADGNMAVALLPDIETIQWHHARENFVSKELHGETPRSRGAIVGDEVGDRVWCYWTRMWYNNNPKESTGNTLHILRLVIEKEADTNWGKHAVEEKMAKYAPQIAALMAAARREAMDWNMQHVEAWNPSDITIEAAKMLDPKTEVIHRGDESIASLLWFPPHEGDIAESIDWIHNEKYGWC